MVSREKHLGQGRPWNCKGTRTGRVGGVNAGVGFKG